MFTHSEVDVRSGVDCNGRRCTWIKAEYSAMPMHVRIVKQMMVRSELSLVALGAVDADLRCNLTVGQYSITNEISQALNAKLVELCHQMQDGIAEVDRIPPCWSCLVCVLRDESTCGSRATYSMCPTDANDFRLVLVFDDFEIHTIHGAISNLKWCPSPSSSSSSSPPTWML